MNEAIFKAIAYGVALSLKWRVGQISQPGVTPNIWAAELVHGSTAYYLLCSENEDWAVSSYFEPGTCRLQFEDCGQLASQLEALFGIHVLSKKELEAPITPRRYLSKSDVSYWKPHTTGDALFKGRHDVRRCGVFFLDEKGYCDSDKMETELEKLHNKYHVALEQINT